MRPCFVLGWEPPSLRRQAGGSRLGMECRLLSACAKRPEHVVTQGQEPGAEFRELSLARSQVICCLVAFGGEGPLVLERLGTFKALSCRKSVPVCLV